MDQQQQTNNSALERLSDSGLVLSEPVQDIRGRKVLDQHGADIGHVSGLFIDERERKVRLLELRTGGFIGIGERHFLLPVDAIASVDENEVHVSESGKRIVHSPVYDPKLVVPRLRLIGSRIMDIMVSRHTGAWGICIRRFFGRAGQTPTIALTSKAPTDPSV